MIKKEIADILMKIDNDEYLNKQDAVKLLSVDNHSFDFYSIIAKANELSRKEYGNKGYVFAQIGLNSSRCSGNCRFCSLAKDSFSIKEESNKAIEDVLFEAKVVLSQNIDALFLMTTADFPQERFLEIGAKVKSFMPDGVKLVANIGDFDIEMARKLKNAGFSAVYHIVRLNEAIDTDITVEERIKTLDAIKEAGLELFYCIEPIGPEHTYEQIADEMIRARDYNVDVMAAMRRVCVVNTPLFEKGEITELELTKIVAVTRLVTRPKTSMNVHEPMKMPLLAGVNQLYAEMGINPRDNIMETKNSRGFSVYNVAKMLSEADYIANVLK
ncbi:radical SAM protein [Paludicola sp. MB14-C6]|uniref:radical SAM protein n=1 Tax=Paludihabitans sp. MB14-C6 TaxID=3070656 RepID=UPI0027DCB424|nr:radical SAM protein [Paludicola sp. MB14-C6]WMJ22230.1 radical SAM protein [Paludicola sp. MB14-C6]